MVTKTIKWNIGSGNIVVIYDTDIISVTSNVNTLSESRKQVVDIESTDGNNIRLTVIQDAKNDIKWLQVFNITYFNNISELKSGSYGLSKGDVVKTKGYYEINDGGGSTYYITDNIQDINNIDDATLIKLDNNLYAEIEIPSDGIINFRQLGAISQRNGLASFMTTENEYDCNKYINKYIKYCERSFIPCKLHIPSGVWCFSPTEIYSESCDIVIEGDSCVGAGFRTVIYSITNTISFTQDYIWYIGNKNAKNNDEYAKNVKISNIQFGGNIADRYAMGHQNGIYKTFATLTQAGLVINKLKFSYFDDIRFVLQKALKVSNSNNIYFGYSSIINCGYYNKNNEGIVNLGNNIYNFYIEYFNIDHCFGTAIYGSGDSDSLCQFVINNLQIEMSGSDGTDPGENAEIKYFIIDGKIGSKQHPAIINNISGGQSFYGWGTVSGKSYKLLGYIGHGVNGKIGSCITIGSISGAYKANNTYYLYDCAVGSDIRFNTTIPSDAICLKNSGLPLFQQNIKTSSVIYAADVEPQRVSTIQGSNGLCNIVGMNEPDEYYTFFATNTKEYSIYFYNTNSISNITVETYSYSQKKWIPTISNVKMSNPSITGWTLAKLPNFKLQNPCQIRIKGLPKQISYFSEL